MTASSDRINDSKLKPKIDYTLKAVGGSLTAIPGLSDMIDGAKLSNANLRGANLQRAYLRHVNLRETIFPE